MLCRISCSSSSKQTLEKEKSIDFVFTNEGVYSLRNILKLESLNLNKLKNVKGIAYRDASGKIHINLPERVVPTDRMDIDLPGYAWDLLPFKNSPLDLYRAMWHAEYDFNKRSPYASLQTSLGCMFKCNFCMINLINRNNDDEIGSPLIIAR